MNGNGKKKQANPADNPTLPETQLPLALGESIEITLKPKKVKRVKVRNQVLEELLPFLTGLSNKCTCTLGESLECVCLQPMETEPEPQTTK